jgi:hypothetical protein
MPRLVHRAPSSFLHSKSGCLVRLVHLHHRRPTHRAHHDSVTFPTAWLRPDEVERACGMHRRPSTVLQTHVGVIDVLNDSMQRGIWIGGISLANATAAGIVSFWVLHDAAGAGWAVIVPSAVLGTLGLTIWGAVVEYPPPAQSLDWNRYRRAGRRLRSSADVVSRAAACLLSRRPRYSRGSYAYALGEPGRRVGLFVLQLAAHGLALVSDQCGDLLDRPGAVSTQARESSAADSNSLFQLRRGLVARHVQPALPRVRRRCARTRLPCVRRTMRAAMAARADRLQGRTGGALDWGVRPFGAPRQLADLRCQRGPPGLLRRRAARCSTGGQALCL